ncbi:PAS domain-containing protein [Ensifer canadensis]
MLNEARRKLMGIEAEIAAARERLELTLEAAGAASSWDWDITANQLSGDARFATLLGLDPLELKSGVPTRHFFSSIHPEDVQRIRLAVTGILAGAEIFSKEYRLVKRDRGIRWVRAEGRGIAGEDEEPIRFVGTLVDITDQRLAQERLRIAQEAGGIGTLEHVAGFATVNVSDQLCRLFGLHPTKVLPVQTLNNLTHAGDPLIIDLDRPDGPQSVADREFRITRADDGKVRWLAQRGEYVEVGQGGRRYIGVLYDVTDAKASQEQLREANLALAERARGSMRERNRMWRNSRDLFLVLNASGDIKDVNPVWHEILGSPSRWALGRSIIDFTWPDDQIAMLKALQAAAKGGRYDFELRVKHEDGSPRWISWRTSQEDDIIYGFGRDITLEREQAETLKDTEAQLRQSQKMEAVGQLTGGIAHDFNNMLTGITGALAILRRRITAGRLDDLDRFIDAAINSAHRAASLTHRLLAFSRRQSLDRQAIEVNNLIHSMEDLLHRTLGEQISLSVIVQSEDCCAFTDANQLENAILNLAINARDAMPDGGKLTIGAENVVLTKADISRNEEVKPGAYVVISVRDTGTGMTAETIAKAFDPFFTTKPIGQGTGLGLSMIYGFAQQSGGHARIRSELGSGTTVELFLPVAAEIDETNAPLPRRDSGALMGDGETVLVVEDDSTVRLLIVDVLKELGYRTIEAENGEKALPIVEGSQHLDLVVSDVGLPGMNGRQLAEMAIRRRPGLRVLFVTGYAATAASRADFLEPGMDMITKPFAMDDLARKVREILTSQ